MNVFAIHRCINEGYGLIQIFTEKIRISPTKLWRVWYGEYEAVIGGDFNTAYKRNNAHSTLLRNFCEEESLINANMHTQANIEYTYCNYASGATSIIDHFLLTEQA